MHIHMLMHAAHRAVGSDLPNDGLDAQTVATAPRLMNASSRDAAVWAVQGAVPRPNHEGGSADVFLLPLLFLLAPSLGVRRWEEEEALSLRSELRPSLTGLREATPSLRFEFSALAAPSRGDGPSTRGLSAGEAHATATEGAGDGVGSTAATASAVEDDAVCIGGGRCGPGGSLGWCGMRSAVDGEVASKVVGPTEASNDDLVSFLSTAGGGQAAGRGATVFDGAASVDGAAAGGGTTGEGRLAPECELLDAVRGGLGCSLPPPTPSTAAVAAVAARDAICGAVRASVTSKSGGADSMPSTATIKSPGELEESEPLPQRLPPSP